MGMSIDIRSIDMINLERSLAVAVVYSVTAAIFDFTKNVQH